MELSNLLGRLICYEENGVLWIQYPGAYKHAMFDLGIALGPNKLSS